MGTNMQDVFDVFFKNVPNVNFTGKESQIMQYFKSSIAKCHRYLYDNLDYMYDEDLGEGSFNNNISIDAVELIGSYMSKEYYTFELGLLTQRKEYMGTQAFNKLPSTKEKLETLKTKLQECENDINKQLNNIPDYSDER